MKTEFEPQDIEVIVNQVAEKLKPLIINNGKPADDDILDVQGVADYLKVTKQWVYEKVHQNAIPHHKLGKFIRFRKSTIDVWLEKVEKGNSRKSPKPVRRLLEDAP